jgi:hypothetical protein
MPLDYFKGRIVSIITGPTNRNFRDEAAAHGRPEIYPQNLIDHFIGVVEEITNTYLLLRHPVIGTKSYYRLENIIGIIEEQYTEDPELIKQLEDKREANIKEKQQYQNMIAENTADSVPCPKCGARLKMPDLAPGTEVMCPACRHQFTLPGAQAPPMPQSNDPHVDLDTLTKLAREAKEKFNQG